MIKCLILDLDGTAVDTVASLAYSVNQVIERLGLKTQPEEKFNYYAGDGARNMFMRCLSDAGDPEHKKLEEALSIYPSVFENGCIYKVRAYDGLYNALRTIKDMDIKLAVFTNKAQLNADKVIRTVYGDLIDLVLGESDRFERKPCPDGALWIAEHFQAVPGECLYVGDTNTDMKTGLSAGMITCGVTWGFRERAELEDFHPDYIIDEASTLISIVEERNKEHG